MQRPVLQSNARLQNAASVAAFMGGPGPFFLGAGLLTGGRILGQPQLADVGLHLTEGVLLAASITALGKGISGRALPGSGSIDSDDFSLGRGFHRRNGRFVSFPSGHTAAAFAMAAVLTEETKRLHPQAARVLAPIAYGGAALVGFARMYQNVHWASDLPMAALIGTWSGTSVVAHAHLHTTNALEHWLTGLAVTPSARGGVAVGWSTSGDVSTR